MTHTKLWRVLPSIALVLWMAPAMAASPAKLPPGDEFKSVALAQGHCPGDSVVWSSLSKSKAYHLAKSRFYGKTKHGAYVCEKDAAAAGFHASRS